MVFPGGTTTPPLMDIPPSTSIESDSPRAPRSKRVKGSVAPTRTGLRSARDSSLVKSNSFGENGTAGESPSLPHTDTESISLQPTGEVTDHRSRSNSADDVWTAKLSPAVAGAQLEDFPMITQDDNGL